MRLHLLMLAALFALAAIGFSFAQSNNSTVDDPPPIPAGCFDDSECPSGQACVNDECVSQGGGGGGGGGGIEQPSGGWDWEWAGWQNPSQESPPESQEPAPEQGQPGNEDEPALPQQPPVGSGNTNIVSAAADIPAQISQGIGDFLSAFIGELGRNPLVIAAAAAGAVFLLAFGALAGLAYLKGRK